MKYTKKHMLVLLLTVLAYQYNVKDATICFDHSKLTYHSDIKDLV